MRNLAVVSILMFLVGSGIALASKSKLLPRSIYVPVRFEVCEHITDAVLYDSNVDGDEVQALAVMPGERVFLFTYYPALERVEPAQTIIKVVGTAPEKPVSHYITITLDAIYLSPEKVIELDKDVKERLKHKQDVRHKQATINIQCTNHDSPKDGAASD